MVYVPLYHDREIAGIFNARYFSDFPFLFSLFLQSEIRKIYQYFLIVFNKIIIPLKLVGCEMIIADSASRLVSYLSSHIQRALVE